MSPHQITVTREIKYFDLLRLTHTFIPEPKGTKVMMLFMPQLRNFQGVIFKDLETISSNQLSTTKPMLIENQQYA